jgi:hypothetical protein
MDVNLNAFFGGLGATEQAWFKAGDSFSCGLRSIALIVHVLPGSSLALVNVKHCAPREFPHPVNRWIAEISVDTSSPDPNQSRLYLV